MLSKSYMEMNQGTQWDSILWNLIYLNVLPLSPKPHGPRHPISKEFVNPEVSATNPVILPGNWSQVAFLARAVITVNKIQSPVTLAIADKTTQGGVLELKWLHTV